MEASPSSPLIVSKPELLLEFLIVALDAPAQLGAIDQTLEGNIFWQRREPILGRLSRAFGPFDQQPFLVVRAKRDDSRSAVPSRQPIVRQARFGKPSAISLAETGRRLALRRRRVGGRPRPDHRFAGSGYLRGGHSVVLDTMPAT